MVQDCADFLNGHGFYCSYGAKVSVVNDEKLCYYVRGNADAWLQSVQQDTWGSGVITKPVAVSQMHRWLATHPEAFLAALPPKF